jgi:DNA-binding NtrC family response regulator
MSFAVSHSQAEGSRRRAPLAPVFQSAAMREIIAAAEDVAVANTTVLISGESGTGKEVLSRYIHQCSPRAKGPWVAINCAALPADLLEGELFGHERGAFTGASERRIGRIELAHQGTLLLDEISELPFALQAKLLRVLQEREVDRVGGRRPVPVDVRIIATSNRTLASMVSAGQFRADLYYRLNVFPLALPPLRDRAEDIPGLAHELLRAVSQSLGRRPPVLADQALRALAHYAFPGNVRELSNILERALVRCRQPMLEEIDLALPPGPGAPAPAPAHGAPADGSLSILAELAQPPGVGGAPAPSFPAGLPLDLAALEELAIAEALRVEGGNRTHAARRLGISIRTLRNKLGLYRQRASGGAVAHLACGAPDTGTHTAAFADRQTVPGRMVAPAARARSTTLARPSQRLGCGEKEG